MSEKNTRHHAPLGGLAVLRMGPEYPRDEPGVEELAEGVLDPLLRAQLDDHAVEARGELPDLVA
jgi:hypothetical protein